MPFDGLMTYRVARALSRDLTEGRIDKIYQPEADQILLNIRRNGQMHHLLLSASAGAARIQLTRKKAETPLSPPMFCMLLRKYLSGAVVKKIEQISFDRIVRICFEAMDEMGDRCERSLILEMMGKHSNLILTDGEDRILDSIRRVSLSMSSVRQIGPGLSYHLPTHNKKADPMELMEKPEMLDTLFADMDIHGSLEKGLYTAIYGFCPLSARELLYLAKIDSRKSIFELTQAEKDRLRDAYVMFMQRLLDQESPDQPVLYRKEDGGIYDFTPFSYRHLEGLPASEYEDLWSLLDDYYAQVGKKDVLKQKAQDLRHLVNTNLDRVRRKTALQTRQIEDTRDREKYRIYGDLITANVYQLHEGMSLCDLPNYYEEDMPLVRIRLDQNLTPAQNAQKYYARYNKLKRTDEALQVQIRDSAKEQEYLEHILSALDLADCEQDLSDIRLELHQRGYLKHDTSKSGRKQKKNLLKSVPLRFVTSEGVEGLVGKNNIQNDELTFKTARPYDEWFHVKNRPGSHVILKIQDLKENQDYTEVSILEAAGIAAYYSSGKEDMKPAVDHTRRMYVKKPAGAAPGFVRYTHERTIFVPEENIRPVQD
ncbi:MAG: NFACT family protein [Firmicutes bacterium]|nr:NFACT family protein [Bacillota bacterium]